MPGDPISSQTSVSLEVEEGPRAIRSENTVYPSGVEPKASQTQLEISNVVAPHHRRLEVKVAVAKGVAGFDQSSQGCGIEQTVLTKPFFGLETAKMGLGIKAERALSYLDIRDLISEFKQAPV